MYPAFLLYGGVFGLALAIYLIRRRRVSVSSSVVWDEAKEAGLTEPASLHPVIDMALCCGSGACVRACPEKKVIGMIGGKAQLIDPTACIGHGACAAACPTDAITLVFGTARRGVDLPVVQPNFETNVPGLFIAGELGGMGLIPNAIEQGRQAMDAIIESVDNRSARILDVMIVGAGPAGFSASLRAHEVGLKYKTIEQDSFGGTVSHFPRGKLVMTQPANLPIIGRVKFSEISKEKLLEFWKQVRDDTGIEIQFEERLEAVTRHEKGFVVKTNLATYPTRRLLLTIGRRGTPRKLGVPGEDQSKVVYRMIDPEQFKDQHVLVVGGGDSALEAAATLSEETNATVTLAYRGDAFQRAKRKNRERVQAASEEGRLDVRFKTEVESISPYSVVFKGDGAPKEIKNDALIICAGGILPTGFLESLGVQIVTKHGEA